MCNRAALFIVFINDLPDNASSKKYFGCADDLKLLNGNRKPAIEYKQFNGFNSSVSFVPNSVREERRKSHFLKN